MILRNAAATVAVVGLLVTPTLTQAPDPMVGTWKLNVAKSKTSYKSGTTTIQQSGDSFTVTADLTANDGTAYKWSWTAKPDGQDVAVTGTTPYGPGVMASLTRVDARTVKIVGKRNGAEVLSQTIAVAADGKTRTVTTKGKDAKGQTVDSVSVYDKQ